MVIGPWKSASNKTDRKYQPSMVTAASSMSKMVYAWSTGVVALHAQLHRILEGVYNEGVAPRAGPRMDFPFGSCRLVAQVRTELLWRYWRNPYASDHYTWLEQIWCMEHQKRSKK